ncbi:cytochrome P450 [Schizophyllum commune Tattone D]|nr:cytochrome P450 [Schizophyllum commune Tattone D]
MLRLILQDFLVCFLAYLLYLRLRPKPNGLRLPPGPPAEPLLGHIRMRSAPSDLIHIRVRGQHIIVLNVNSVESAVELLKKRGAIHSDRAFLAYFVMLGWHENVLVTSCDHSSFPHLRAHYQSYFAREANRKLIQIQTNEAHKLVQRMTEQPDNWKELFRAFAVAVIIQINTGHEIKTLDDPYLDIANEVGKTLTGGGPPGATGVNILPLLRYLPSWCDSTGSTAFVRMLHHSVKQMYTVPCDRVTEDIRSGPAQPSFMLSLMQEMEAQDDGEKTLSRERIEGLCATAYAGEWTFDTLTTFVFAIVNYPDVQERAKAELNTVVGPDRLPELEDCKDLPYIERLVQEVFRFWPSVPLGVPHKSTKDDIYKGMYIPRGSLLIRVFNVFAMTHDETVYKDPWRFEPDRYLPCEEGGHGEPLPTGHFGFGRRICPGRFVGDASVFIAIATMLHVLTFGKAKDEAGQEITIDPEAAKYTTGITSHPETVLCNIRPTSEQTKKLAMGSYIE